MDSFFHGIVVVIWMLLTTTLDNYATCKLKAW
jgi:hypothetical protein